MERWFAKKEVAKKGVQTLRPDYKPPKRPIFQCTCGGQKERVPGSAKWKCVSPQHLKNLEAKRVAAVIKEAQEGASQQQGPK
ncbi:hypothetical protein A3D70_01660 [Candidatus Adlerbacteria bacterium RIFCSPHIGHO2_02_FULL_54_18]|uniref:Uncharacterized protein n=1 Tax=Candidatus Adlerbacteria bacterium RIFCSPHIGHO2_02_FULL_54_18 TaxID=1797241 RepID=A0A1F4Y5C7_9BACT|nr:MAG: hypothetical protein A3D70_01660 [Candidatus Adlerbacteria bacterium RIFCSPHIGHO2_02_FULL_54_18]